MCKTDAGKFWDLSVFGHFFYSLHWFSTLIWKTGDFLKNVLHLWQAVINELRAFLICFLVKSHFLFHSCRSELVTSVKKSWLTSVLGNEQNWTSIKQCLHQWKVYQCGTALLQRLFETLEAVLPLTGLSLYSLEQLQSCTNLLQVSSFHHFNHEQNSAVAHWFNNLSLFVCFSNSVLRSLWVNILLYTLRLWGLQTICWKSFLSGRVGLDWRRSFRKQRRCGKKPHYSWGETRNWLIPPSR